MVKYENPHIPDHMNRSQTNPLWDFTLLGLLVIGTIAALVFLAFVIGGFLGRLIPFSGEQWIVRQINPDWLERPTTGKAAELQELADRLTAHMNLPDGMEIVVHYVDDPTVNAFATVGGQVVMFRGLVSRVKSENELAMVMAHEIAHIKHRDVASSMGGAFLASALYSMLFGNEGFDGSLVNSAGGLMQLSFSRSAESAADAEGLLAISKEYGHANGATDLFRTLESAQEELPKGALDDFEFLQTHPNVESRINSVEQQAKGLEIALTGPLTPMSESLQAPPAPAKVKNKGGDK
ncbi:MAG TPA: hypothetical protein DFI00_07885 [Rhodospirillaceae bacterium]|nr:hypothetical protein [Rhodospirillaceae bacterium]